LKQAQYHIAQTSTLKPKPVIQDTGIFLTNGTMRGAITTITIAPRTQDQASIRSGVAVERLAAFGGISTVELNRTNPK
jgi:hypothetical protein